MIPAMLPTLALGSHGRSVVIAQKALGKLWYLPVRPKGSRWDWRWKTAPVTLKSLWRRGQYNMLMQGSVLAFQAANNLPITGVLTAQTWETIQTDLRIHRRDPWTYAYAMVHEERGNQIPETLTLWDNGRIVLKTLANTGISQSPTDPGTYAVYLRYTSQTMQGIYPWGGAYDDPGVPWVNYFNGGDAIHGFPRAAYGFPQSLGCVELPIPNAAIAWGYLSYGSIVSIFAE